MWHGGGSGCGYSMAVGCGILICVKWVAAPWWVWVRGRNSVWPYGALKAHLSHVLNFEL